MAHFKKRKEKSNVFTLLASNSYLRSMLPQIRNYSSWRVLKNFHKLRALYWDHFFLKPKNAKIVTGRDQRRGLLTAFF